MKRAVGGGSIRLQTDDGVRAFTERKRGIVAGIASDVEHERRTVSSDEVGNNSLLRDQLLVSIRMRGAVSGPFTVDVGSKRQPGDPRSKP